MNSEHKIQTDIYYPQTSDLDTANESLLAKDLVTNNRHKLPLSRDKYFKHSIDSDAIGCLLSTIVF